MITEKEINSIKWSNFNTAYGKADEVAIFLTNLFSGDKKIAMDATHDLWCGLCHQHAYISNAALPSYDFLKTALLSLDDELKIEIMDILRGFSCCTSTKYYKTSNKSPENWEKELREKMLTDINIFKNLKNHSDEFISGFASDIVEDLMADT